MRNRSAPPPTVAPVLCYPDVRAAVAWLERGLGFRETVRIGESHRAQMRVPPDGAIVVAEGAASSGVVVKIRVPDVDAAFARAIGEGARALQPLTTWPYGERSGTLVDPWGCRWELTQTVRDVAPEEWGGVAVAPW